MTYLPTKVRTKSLGTRQAISRVKDNFIEDRIKQNFGQTEKFVPPPPATEPEKEAARISEESLLGMMSAKVDDLQAQTAPGEDIAVIINPPSTAPTPDVDLHCISCSSPTPQCRKSHKGCDWKNCSPIHTRNHRSWTRSPVLSKMILFGDLCHDFFY